MFIKLYESALFLKYYNVKLHINTKYFGETLEGTGQAEDYRLKLSPKKATIRSIVNKKPVNEFVKTHLLAISRVYVPDSFFIKKTIRYAYGSKRFHRYLKMHLYVLEYILVSQPNIQHEEMLFMSSDTNSLAHTKWNCKYHIVFAPKYRRQVIYGKIKGILELFCVNYVKEKA